MTKELEHGGNHPMGSGLAANPRSRPLKTEKTFTLVVAAPRVHYLAWDRSDYAPGDTCKVNLSGINLGKAPLEVVVEEEQDGAWVEVTKLKSTVDGGQSAATAEWKFPVPPGHAEVLAAQEKKRRGELLRAVWGQEEVTEGSDLAARIEVEGMEGEKLIVLVEREFPDGSWRGVSHAEGEVRSGRCEVAWTPPLEANSAAALAAAAARPAPPAVVACKFEDGVHLGAAETAWLKVDCAGLEQQTVQLVLEHEGEGGWTEVSSAVSTVKAGEARTGMLLPDRR